MKAESQLRESAEAKVFKAQLSQKLFSLRMVTRTVQRGRETTCRGCLWVWMCHAWNDAKARNQELEVEAAVAEEERIQAQVEAEMAMEKVEEVQVRSARELHNATKVPISCLWSSCAVVVGE